MTKATTLKAWTFEAQAKAIGHKAKAFMHMTRAEYNICIMLVASIFVESNRW